MMKKINFAPPARGLERRIASALTVALMVAVSIISILGIGSGAMLTAHAVEAIDVCKVNLVDLYDDGVELTWNTIEGADSYEIYRKTKGGNYQKVAMADGTETSWVDEAATTGVTYTYYVQPVSEDETWVYEEATISHKSTASTYFDLLAERIVLITLAIPFAFLGAGLLCVCVRSDGDFPERFIPGLVSFGFFGLSAWALIVFLLTFL